jgi:hypothetical protein
MASDPAPPFLDPAFLTTLAKEFCQTAVFHQKRVFHQETHLRLKNATLANFQVPISIYYSALG